MLHATCLAGRSTLCTSYLCLASGGDGGGTLPVLDRAAAAAAGLNSLDDLVRLDIAIRNAAEDDVLAVEPRGDDGSDEELGAVAALMLASIPHVLWTGRTCWGRRWPWTGGRACCGST
jgi:hypothetical protein